LEVVSGIIWLVISGFDTTATVTTPELLLLLLPPLALVPLLEQAATVASAATQQAAPRVRSLNREELIEMNLHTDEDVLAGPTLI
jgi:hypothetical protein